jgi:hypothetical protein
MARYRVLHADSVSVTLEDAAGRRHVARALHDALAPGAELHGPRAARGFAILSHAGGQRLCRMIFEQVDCGPAPASSVRPVR